MSKVRSTSVTVKVRTKGTATVTVKIGGPRKQAKPQGQLRFGHGNAKLDAAIFTFSLPAGWACPFAQDCMAKSDRYKGKIKDGPDTQFRCYAASMEARHSSVRNSRWHNYDLLRGKTRDEMIRLILDSLTPYAGYVRVHDSGDFFSQDYFDSWMEVARQRPRTTFYAYTKSLPYWVARLGNIPSNFILTASKGGRHDELIDRHGLRYAQVVYSEAEAEALGLEIDHDDSHAMTPGPSFALLIHGTQPGGTPASKAVSALRTRGEFGYGERADAVRLKNGRLPLATVN